MKRMKKNDVVSRPGNGMRLALKTLCAAASLLVFAARLPAQAPLPPGNQVIQRVMERSATKAKDTNVPVWAYDKRSVKKQLDGNAKVLESEERLFHVRMVQGVPIQKLVKIEGRELTKTQLKEENRNEDAFRERVSGRDARKTVVNREALIDSNLISRFQFTTQRREMLRERPTLVVGFEAKPGKDADSIPEQLMRRMTGTLWVDESTAEVAQLDVSLSKPLSLGAFGMLGTIRDCRLALHSTRMPDGTWVPHESAMSFSARFLLKNIRFLMEETSTNYSLEAAPPPAAP